MQLSYDVQKRRPPVQKIGRAAIAVSGQISDRSLDLYSE